jgi:PhnB protein
MNMTRNVNPIPKGFHSVTTYLVCPGVPRLLDFVKQAFGAVETVRTNRPDGSVSHAAVKIGDSMVEMGEPMEPGKAMTAALHYYVEDADSVYRRALKAGGTSLYEPTDQEYGDREAGVKDPSGNDWYIATHKTGKSYVPEGLRNVNTGFSVTGCAKFLEFLTHAFGATVKDKFETPNGTVGHANVQIGDSVVECSEAHGQWGPRAVTIHLYVPDVDAVYQSALKAAARSISEPKDQFYGERNGGVIDPCGNYWYIATQTEELSLEEVYRRAATQTGSP